MMHIGVTGTREGMDSSQYHQIKAFLDTLKETVGVCTLHHGDCRGVDEEVALMCQEIGFKIVCHPPTSKYLRAYFPSDEIRPAYGYLERDQHIVDESEFLMVVPMGARRKGSGTWYTHDYAVKRKKPVEIFYTEGMNAI